MTGDAKLETDKEGQLAYLPPQRMLSDIAPVHTAFSNKGTECNNI